MTEGQLKEMDREVKRTKQTISQKKRGKYNRYTPEQRAQIGKFTAENGPANAAARFSQLFGFNVSYLLVANFS